MTEAPSYSAAIEIKHIRRRADARPLSEDAVAALAASIEQIGLINPIRVRAVSRTDYEVVAGHHRFEACKRAGWADVPCIVVAEDDLHAELAMIDENLMRAELSASDRAAQTARRKAIYETLYPEAKHGQNIENIPSGQFVHTETPSFATATAKSTGRDARSVRRDAERGEKVTQEALALVRGTKLDTGTYLDKLKRLAPNDQVKAVRRDLAEPPRPRNVDPSAGGIAGRYAPAPEPADVTPAEAFQRFLKLADELFELDVAKIIDGAGRQRSVLGQRAASLGHRMDEIAERLSS